MFIVVCKTNQIPKQTPPPWVPLKSNHAIKLILTIALTSCPEITCLRSNYMVLDWWRWWRHVKEDQKGCDEKNRIMGKVLVNLLYSRLRSHQAWQCAEWHSTLHKVNNRFMDCKRELILTWAACFRKLLLPSYSESVHEKFKSSTERTEGTRS